MNQPRGKESERMKSSPWMELPPPVARHVRQQLEAVDWDAAVQQLRSVCTDCPARQQDADEICLACPFDGLACMAATVALKARIAKMQAKSQSSKKNEKLTIAKQQKDGNK